MISADADFMYPCFRADEVEKALHRMTSKLGFQPVESYNLRHVYTYQVEDLRLIVMATPRVFRRERMCYAFSGVLIKNEDWFSEVEMLPQPAAGQTTSTWRKNPKDFYQDLIVAIEKLRPDMCLPAFEPKLLGPALKTTPANRTECWDWNKL